jgi:uncharacterized protein YciI
MFVLELTYTVPNDQIDALLPEHNEWLAKHYEAGLFLAAGRKQPRDGGVIIATAPSRAAIEAVVATDPLLIKRATEYRITEFLATTTAPALDAYREQLPGRR